MNKSFFDRDRFLARLQQEDISMDGEMAELYAILIFDAPLEIILQNRDKFVNAIDQEEIDFTRSLAEKIPQIKPAIAYILDGHFLQGQLSIFPTLDTKLLPYGKDTDLEKTLFQLFLNEVVPDDKELTKAISRIDKCFRRVISQNYPTLSKVLSNQQYGLKLVPETYYTFNISTHEHLIDLWETYLIRVLDATIKSSPLFRTSTINYQYTYAKSHKEPITLDDIEPKQREPSWKKSKLFDQNSLSPDVLTQQRATTPSNNDAKRQLDNFFYNSFGHRPGKHTTLTIQGPEGSGKSTLAEYAASKYTRLFPHKSVRRYTAQELSHLAQKAFLENKARNNPQDNNPFSQMKEEIFSANILIIEGAEQLKAKYTCGLINEFSQKAGVLCVFVIDNQVYFDNNVTNNVRYKEDEQRLKEYHKVLTFSTKLQLEPIDEQSASIILNHQLAETRYSHISLSTLQKTFILNEVKDCRHYPKLLQALGRNPGPVSNNAVTKAVTSCVAIEHYLPFESIYTYLKEYFEEHKLRDIEPVVVRERSQISLLKKLSTYLFKKLLEGQRSNMKPNTIAQQCGFSNTDKLITTINHIYHKLHSGARYIQHMKTFEKALAEKRNDYVIMRDLLV